MSTTLFLEDLIIDVATELAISGECDRPMSNVWGGVDLVAPGYFESGPAYSADGLREVWVGVRIAIEDNAIHIYKFGRFGVIAKANFAGAFTALPSVISSVVKGWI